MSLVKPPLFFPKYSDCFLKENDVELENFYVTQTPINDQTICVLLRGRLYFKTEKSLREILKQIVMHSAYQLIEINFAEVTFIDSLAFAALISILRCCHEQNKKLRFVSLPNDLKCLVLASPLADCITEISLLNKSYALLTKKANLSQLDEGIELTFSNKSIK